MRSQAIGVLRVAAAPASSNVDVIACFVASGRYCHMIEWNSTRAVPASDLANCRRTKSAASALLQRKRICLGETDRRIEPRQPQRLVRPDIGAEPQPLGWCRDIDRPDVAAYAAHDFDRAVERRRVVATHVRRQPHWRRRVAPMRAAEYRKRTGRTAGSARRLSRSRKCRAASLFRGRSPASRAAAWPSARSRWSAARCPARGQARRRCARSRQAACAPARRRRARPADRPQTIAIRPGQDQRMQAAAKAQRQRVFARVARPGKDAAAGRRGFIEHVGQRAAERGGEGRAERVACLAWRRNAAEAVCADAFVRRAHDPAAEVRPARRPAPSRSRAAIRASTASAVSGPTCL